MRICTRIIFSFGSHLCYTTQSQAGLLIKLLYHRHGHNRSLINLGPHLIFFQKLCPHIAASNINLPSHVPWEGKRENVFQHKVSSLQQWKQRMLYFLWLQTKGREHLFQVLHTTSARIKAKHLKICIYLYRIHFKIFYSRRNGRGLY